MAVSKRLRYEIFRRDNHACRYCGACAPDAVLTVDHVVATTLGGTDDPSNLVTACKDCNAGKSSASADAGLIADVKEDALRWAQAIQLATEQAMVERDERNRVAQGVADVFSQYQVASYRGGGTLADRMPGDSFASVEQFMRAGLDKLEIMDAAFIAAEAPGVKADDAWRYFCGVCRSKIRERQERVAAALRLPQAGVEPIPHTDHCSPDCELLNTPDDACPECAQHHCEWYCGYYAGRAVWQWLAANRAIEDDPGARGYAQLSRVCDGAMLAEMGI